MRTIGTIQLLESGKEKKININGLSWLDREWSTTALSKEQVGWDWFSIQLNDSTELMYFKLRNKNGSADFAKGTLIYANGLTKKLYQSDLFIEEKSFWKNEKGDKYPSKWLLSIPSENIKLTIATKIPDQELKLNLRYYEGSIRINGFNGKCEVNGSGFVEMTGYSN